MIQERPDRRDTWGRGVRKKYRPSMLSPGGNTLPKSPLVHQPWALAPICVCGFRGTSLHKHDWLKSLVVDEWFSLQPLSLPQRSEGTESSTPLSHVVGSLATSLHPEVLSKIMSLAWRKTPLSLSTFRKCPGLGGRAMRPWIMDEDQIYHKSQQHTNLLLIWGAMFIIYEAFSLLLSYLFFPLMRFSTSTLVPHCFIIIIYNYSISDVARPILRSSLSKST